MSHVPQHCACPRWTRNGVALRARQSASSRATPTMGAHRGYDKKKRRLYLSSPWSLVAGAMPEDGRRRGNKTSVASSCGQEAWNREKRCGMWQCVVGEDGVVCGTFYRVVVVGRGSEEEEMTGRRWWSLTHRFQR
jgi:hypothetical protein